MVELSLKAALRCAGIETQKIHDVGILLRAHQEKFPASFRRRIGRLAAISRRLRMERELSFYGDEQTGISPQDIYDREDAAEYLKDAAFVLEQCWPLLEGPKRKRGV